MFIGTFFVIVRNWKKPEYSSTEEWIKKMWNIHIVRLLLSGKNKDMLNSACKWMELENTILSEVTQTKKNEYGIMYSLISGY